MRDYLILPLREVGIVQQSFVVPAGELADFANEIVVYGFHRTKSGNNAYVLSDAAKELLEVDEAEWDERLAEFVASDPNRRLRRLQQRASAKVQAATGAAGKHAALIEAAVDALLQSRCKDFDLVFVDDADGNRIREESRVKLEALDLMPDLSSRWPDAILVKGSEVWFVDAVTTDGDIDEVRKQDLERWAPRRASPWPATRRRMRTGSAPALASRR